MLTLTEFKIRYENQIEDYELTESEVKKAYSVYCEDPFEFHPDMVESSVRE